MGTGSRSGHRPGRVRRIARRLVCEVLERRELLSLVVTSTSDDSSPNTLRWAIQQANAGSTSSTIEIDFNIPGPGSLAIHLASPLPSITVPVLIDGTTEPGYQGIPLIEVDGSGLAGAGHEGLVLTAAGNMVRGLSLVGFSGSAIVLASGGASAIAGNYLGLTPSGSGAVPNHEGITLLGSSGNTIGAGIAGTGNVISGNTGDGVLIEPGGGADSTDNLIVGNRIGTSPDGLHVIPNSAAGIAVSGGSAIQIGAPGQVFANVVSGNAGPGISLTGGAQGTSVRNNLIGLGADGKTPLGNQGDGIQLDDAPATQIGGTDFDEGNVIAANGGNGIWTSGNTAGLQVVGNKIGTDATTALQLGNHRNGVSLASSSNTIGGTGAGASNVIEFNGSGTAGAGVQLVGTVDHNSILSNSIYGNADLGISFGGDQPTPNHAPGTPGPNDYVNYPVLSIATNDGTATSIQGTLYESPNTSYLLQFFSSPQRDGSGYGQGKSLIGSLTVDTDGQGKATFTTGLPPTAGPGVFVSATATDPAGNTSEFSGDVSVQGRINLAISGAAAPDPVVAGANLTYTLTVTNKGTIDAQSVVLSDQLPSGVTIVSVAQSQGGLMNMLGGTVSVALGRIAAGGSASVDIVVKTGPGSIGTITDTATATSGQDQESTSIRATVVTSADLSISLAATAPTVLAGGNLTYTMTVTNDGPGPASKVVASLPLGPNLTFVSANATIGSASFAGDQVSISLGNMASGTQSIVTVVVQTTAAGSLTETAAVSGDSLDPDPSNNSASVTTEVDPAADLSVKIDADTDVLANGVPFTYTVTVTNNGPSDATNVVLKDTLPAGVALVTASTDSGLTPGEADGAVSVTFPTLAAGSSAQMLMAVNPAASPGSKQIDTATVKGDQADPNPANNAASLGLPVRGVSDLAVTATIQPGPYYVGRPLTYTVKVTNNGPADEPDAVVASALPDGLLVDSTRSTQGADPPVNNGILTADLGPLGAGQTAVVTLVVTTGPGDAGTLTTVFNAQGLDYDPDPSNNTAPVSVTVDPSCDLSVAISPGNTAAVAQLGWSYAVRVKNSGPSQATGVIARIPVPPAVQFDSASTSQGLATIGQDGILTADLGVIAAGGSATITLNVEPTQSVGGGSIPLAASVNGDEYDPDPANNQTSLNLAVTPSVKVALVLQSTPQVIQSGRVITFTASVSNRGSTPATNVIVTFPQVNGLAFLSSTPSQGTPALVSGQFFARMGAIEPGASAMVTVQELATFPGTFTQAATVSEDEYNLDYALASATASAQVLESPGMLQLSAGNYQVTDQAGVAEIPVIRLYGASGTVTVHYQTAAINATPGLDFTPIEGTLTLGPGQGSGSIQVPVLDDPYNNHDEYVSIALDGPTGGAVLGPTTSAVLHIQDVDPNFTPPRVSSFTWAGSPAAITSLTLHFTAPLDPTYATNPEDYHLVELVGGSIPIASIHYDATQFAVTIVPQSPIPSGRYAQLQLVGLGPAAIRDIAGNVLDGVGNGAPGSDYTVTFAQGTRLKYVDNAGNIVKLRVRGRGYLQQVLDGSGRGILLNLVGMVPHRTTLTGQIKRHKQSSGQTELGTITGLGQFGDVKVRMKAPPFRVNQLPFQRRGRYIL